MFKMDLNATFVRGWTAVPQGLGVVNITNQRNTLQASGWVAQLQIASGGFMQLVVSTPTTVFVPTTGVTMTVKWSGLVQMNERSNP